MKIAQTPIETRTRRGGGRLCRARLSLAGSLVILFSNLIPFTSPVSARLQGGDAGLRVDLPANGELRVENRRGGVSVEVWGEKYVSVAATVEGAAQNAPARAAKSPVRLDRTDRLLTVSVASAAASTTTAPNSATKTRRGGVTKTPPPDAAPKVDLRLRVPAHARVSVSTGGAGAFVWRGVAPASLSAQTVAGDIDVELHDPLDVGVTAHSLNGSVNFKDTQQGGEQAARQFDRRKFETQFGAGSRAVRLFSGRGAINVTTLAAAQQSQTAATGDATGQPDAATAVQTPATKIVGSTDAAQTSAATAAAPPVIATTTADESDAAGTLAPPKLKNTNNASGSARPSASPASADAPEEVDDEEVVRVETELVKLNFSVVDRASGRGLVGLTSNDFKLFEDGAEQRIEHFESASVPFDLLLLIDLSGSTGKVTNTIRAAAASFVAAARTQDRIGVVTFASNTKVVSPLTTDRDALRAAITSMEQPVGDTKLYDAINFAADYLDKQGAPARRHAVVLMSDGLDSTLPNVTGDGSTASYDDVRRRIEEFEGVFYSIWTSTEYEAFSPEDIQPETFDLVHDRMLEISEAGGGVFYEVERLEDLAGAYERVVADLGTLYSLSYRPTNKARDGRFRAIRVRLPTRPDAVARGKRGYYAK